MAHARVSPLSVSDAPSRVGRLGARLSRATPRARVARVMIPPCGPQPVDATKGAAKRASETVGEKAKSFWNDEVIGAKKAMERNAAAAPGKDVTRDLQVTLEEAVLGAKKSLSFERKRVCPTRQGTCRLPQTFIDCDQCAAAGLISTPTEVTVTVPRAADGATLRLKDQGDDGDPPGQLYVNARAAADERGRHHRPRRRGPHHPRGRRALPRARRTHERAGADGEWGNLKVAADAKPAKGSRFGTRARSPNRGETSAATTSSSSRGWCTRTSARRKKRRRTPRRTREPRARGWARWATAVSRAIVSSPETPWAPRFS